MPLNIPYIMKKVEKTDEIAIDENFLFSDIPVSQNMIDELSADCDLHITNGAVKLPNGYIKDDKIMYIAYDSCYSYDIKTNLKTKIPITGNSINDGGGTVFIIFSHKTKKFYRLYRNYPNTYYFYAIDLENMSCTQCCNQLGIDDNGISSLLDSKSCVLNVLLFDDYFLYIAYINKRYYVYKVTFLGVKTQIAQFPSDSYVSFENLVNLWIDDSGILYVLSVNRNSKYSAYWTEFKIYKNENGNMRNIKKISIYTDTTDMWGTAEFVTYSTDRHHMLLWPNSYNVDDYGGNSFLYSIDISETNDTAIIKTIPYNQYGNAKFETLEFTKNNNYNTRIRFDDFITNGISWAICGDGIYGDDISHIDPAFVDYYSEGVFYHLLSQLHPYVDDGHSEYHKLLCGKYYQCKVPLMRKFEYKRR